MEKVILAHGFLRTQRDMYPLRNYLQDFGYDARTVNLPTTFKSLEACCTTCSMAVEPLLGEEIPLHFVGHSMGGLIVRMFVEDIPAVCRGRCVLIGPPNNGSLLAEQAARLLGPLARLFGGLQSLRPGAIKSNSLLARCSTPCGVIAGTDHRLFRGLLLPREHDGMVTVEETRMPGMADFITLPYVHTEIHRKRETAVLVDRFLQTGTFRQ